MRNDSVVRPAIVVVAMAMLASLVGATEIHVFDAFEDGDHSSNPPWFGGLSSYDVVTDPTNPQNLVLRGTGGSGQHIPLEPTISVPVAWDRFYFAIDVMSSVPSDFNPLIGIYDGAATAGYGWHQFADRACLGWGPGGSSLICCPGTTACLSMEEADQSVPFRWYRIEIWHNPQMTDPIRARFTDLSDGVILYAGGFAYTDPLATTGIAHVVLNTERETPYYYDNVVLATGAADCNGNDVPDAVELLRDDVVDNNANGVPDECECYAWTLRATDGPPARYRHGMVHDGARGVTVLFGGAGSVASDTWQWDGNAWLERCNICGPASRVNSPLAYDSVRQRIVMFGGQGGGFLGDTWEWGGNAWSQPASSGPSPREGHILVYDRVRNETVLFGGGQETQNHQGDTWTWDGTTWTQVASTGPAARQEAAAAFDEVRGVVVLFGGRVGNSYFGDTWEWDGTTWTMRSNSGPTPRAVHSMVYDTDSGKVILFGGGNGLVPFGDIWVWDGNQWTQQAVSGPQPGYGYGLAYDRARRRTVLFGGATTGAPFDETWELDFGDPVITQQPASETEIVGGLASFSVAAEGPVAYQWRRHGANLTNGGRIAGVTTATLTITSVEPADAGAYDVVISNACGSITSTSASLTVHPDCGSDALLPIVLVSSKATDSVVAYQGNTGAVSRTFLLAAAGVDYPNGLIVDETGNFYVASVGSDSVLKFNGRTGQLLLQFSGGGLLDPDGILIHESTPGVPSLLASSFSTDSVKQYDLATGASIGDFVLPGAGFPGATLDGPAGLIHAANGNLLVASQIGDQVLEFDAATGDFVGVAAQGCGLNGPEGLLLMPDGGLLVASFLGGDVLRFAPNGSCSVFVPAGSGGLAGPSTLAWASNGNLLVASRYTHNLLEYDATSGAFVREFAVGGGLSQPTHLAVANWCDADCNTNGMLDRWDVDEGRSTDVNHNGRPDECDGCIGDIAGSGDNQVGLDDLTLLLSNFGCTSPPAADCRPSDLDNDGDVDVGDLAILLSRFGTVCP